MAEYQHILLAVDFSPEAGVITRKGREIAGPNGAKVSLVHVVEYTGSTYPPEVPFPEGVDLSKRLLEHAEVALKELAITHGLPDARRYVESGSPKQEITRIAEENAVDLIIIGSHGRHGLQLLLGSTANGVLHLAKCDVLAVRVGHR